MKKLPITKRFDIHRKASISSCGLYRYELLRWWGPGISCMDGFPENGFSPLVVIGLNPSTADASVDDNTIRKLMGFAEREGANGLKMLNAYAFRSTDPRGLGIDDPVGPFNDHSLSVALRFDGKPRPVIVGWGRQPWLKSFPARIASIIELARLAARPLACFGVNQDGSPKHPLYLAADTPLQPWNG